MGLKLENTLEYDANKRFSVIRRDMSASIRCRGRVWWEVGVRRVEREVLEREMERENALSPNEEERRRSKMGRK